MRVCEEQLIRALRQGKAWKGKNTECSSDGTVTLFGNTIATKTPMGWRFNLCGWNAPTTRSRINAIRDMLGLPGIRRDKGGLYLAHYEPRMTPAERRAHRELHHELYAELPTNGWFE